MLGSRATLRCVPDQQRQTLTVTLEVDPTSDPIQGIARDEHGAERSFSGWVGLATALEHALEIRVANLTDGPPGVDP
jgi:hypothetical protein